MKYVVVAFLLAFVCLAACESKQQASEDENCVKPGSPMKMAPMAIAMRTMHAQSVQIKTAIDQGKTPTVPVAEQFWKVEPTDSTVLTEDFFERAKLWETAWNNLRLAPTADKHDAMLNTCMNCHQEYCVGPMKKISKVYINPDNNTYKKKKAHD